MGFRLGVPIIRFIVLGGLYWDPHILGNYHMGLQRPCTLLEGASAIGILCFFFFFLMEPLKVSLKP